MPELPEVETIVRALRHGGRDGPSLLGRTFASAEVLWPRTLAEPSIAELQARLPGQTITGLGRRGKFAMFHLTRDTLLAHLRMSGDLRVEPAFSETGEPLPLQPHDRADLYLHRGPAPGLQRCPQVRSHLAGGGP